jgi:hypothetical protein
VRAEEARLLPGRFRRANVPLPQPIPLEDVSPAAIQAMIDSTGTYFQSAEWADIRSWITTNFGLLPVASRVAN